MRYSKRSAQPLPQMNRNTALTTREAIARLLLHGPLTASAMAEELSLTTPAVRRHLDIRVEEGVAVAVDPSPYQERGRGRPAKLFHLSDVGRSHFGHAYDDLAVDALRMVRKLGGERALVDFSQQHMHDVVAGITPLDRDATRADVQECAEKIAQAFNKCGYATSVENARGGIQICQHHCPVAHVAHDFPALCAAEHHILSELLNTPIQRLSTIAYGAHTCTTNVTVPHNSIQNHAERSEA